MVLIKNKIICGQYIQSHVKVLQSQSSSSLGREEDAKLCMCFSSTQKLIREEQWTQTQRQTNLVELMLLTPLIYLLSIYLYLIINLFNWVIFVFYYN